MRPVPRHWLPVITLVCCCFSFNPAQDKSRQELADPAAATDEAGLRALAQEFYAAYAKKDLEGFARLWSARSPELAARRQVTQKLFADHEKIEVKDLVIRKMAVEAEKAELRVEVEMSGVDAKTGKPSAVLGKMVRALQCVKEGGWKVWREAEAEEELAAALIEAKTEQERVVLMAEEKELMTANLLKALGIQGERLRRQGNFPQALAILQMAHSVAGKIGD